ncbi:hypothetical protein ESP57_01045 [Agromyces fucosus]|uniref:ATPase BadF/BadG/BcrA/BcrD type domain-containing protein n=1 Tax=Agromyces fucosus TaxID=41985 RepID=A0A4Q2JW57_9MICO|nr:BadF/BadG/BcrA/BcrD ATPase family protein [Agromyces fucosus]RXZ50438.1 hypothetical protein ESP57_01045 [Agromyces fucosus]
MTRSVLAIDAGQTGIKTRLVVDGAVVRETLLPGIRTHEPLLAQLAQVTAQLAPNTGTDVSGGITGIDTVTAGVSGLTRADADAAALLAAVAPLGVRRVLLAHDSISSFVGALGDDRGAVVASGTGVVTLGVGRERVRRVDGWGNIMGDAGSGYWIGREALEAGMRSYDGRGPETLLSGLITDRWPDIEQAYIDLQADPHRVSVVAAFAEQVAALASVDDVAADICRAAADELALSVLAALQSVGETGPDAEPRLSAIGGVFRSDRIRNRFEHRVRDAVPHIQIIAPKGNGLDGSAALAALAERHPLRAHLTIASVEHSATT